ncbi:GGDEF domain-containing protein [Candidatus Dactylopiibacterium carminicum]|uniref:diguanylate cyclase n=1 Tax=Candidatus Dactylopiibacterium carminicum TaxID=857335 RepID=A0ABQ7HQF0_9RHOO|nr:GGDEF domain-containing protein [Candidatus Dactylopiibacterium carminicum]PAS99420.1 MAG: hypothetical protein BSR46_08130 [Candidatus Dactylopiibacterium carminicum]
MVVTCLEILDARFALLHGFRATQDNYVATPLAWAVAGGESATTNLDHFDLDETLLTAAPLLEEAAHAEGGVAMRDVEGAGYILAFAVGPQGMPVAIAEVHCDALPSDGLNDCVHELLGIYAEHIGLLDYAELDTLTRLHNRKTFDENFDRFISMAEAAQQREEEEFETDPDKIPSCWLGVVDIDRFKRINDNFGHLFGDEVLIRVADLLKRNFRTSDRLFRFGGEEFVVMLRFVSKCSAAAVFERFRLAVETHDFPQVGQVTCSVGYVQIDPSLTPAEILSRADEALYYCKANGRNLVKRYEDLLAAGLITAPLAVVSNDELQADIDALFDN